MSSLDLKINKLSSNTDRSYFDCGNKQLNHFVLESIDTCTEYRFCISYEVWDINLNKLAAIFALSFDSIQLDKDDIEEVLLEKSDEDGNLPLYYSDIFSQKTIFPALSVSHLAVHNSYKRKGVGRYILDAVTILALKQNIGGCQFITIDAINTNDVVTFYSKNDFIRAAPPDPNSPTIKMFKMI